MTTEAQEGILRKIRKCLALSASSNASEAATALRQAQAMMRQHSLSEDDVRGLEVDSDVVKTREGFDTCAYLSELAHLMRDAFGVIAITERNPGTANRANIRYVGSIGRATLAVYTHKVIHRAVDEAWAEHLRQFPWHKSDGGKRTAFRLGWLLAVRSKVEAIGFTEPETRAIKKWQDKTYGNSLSVHAVKVKMDEDEIRLAHLAAKLAQDFHLHRPMNDDGTPADPRPAPAAQLGHDR